MTLTIQETIFQFILEHSTHLFLVFSNEARLLDCNKAASLLLGDNCIGKTFQDIFIDFKGSMSLQDLLATPGVMRNLNINSKSGVPETYQFLAYAFPYQIVVLGQSDFQETFKVRQELVQLHNETSNLARELSKKNAELAKLNETKNQFLGMAAHDLRNPLGNIKNCAEFLLDEIAPDANPDQFEFLTAIKSSSQFMLKLLTNLLDIAKIESGKVQLDLEMLNLVDVISENLQLNRKLAEKKNISIVFTPQEDIPQVRGDWVRLDQVLSNLLSNATKFSQPGTTITVEVSCSSTHVTVAVTDQGPGIPEDELPKLFKSFSRTSVTPTGDELSTGLGLAIVRKLIVEQQGQIHVESKVGTGSTFSFSLPVPDEKIQEERP